MPSLRCLPSRWRGGWAIAFNFADMTDLRLTGVTSIEVRDGLLTMDCPSMAARCELYDFADHRLVKAGWNYVLVHNDGSGGIHNPGYVLDVIACHATHWKRCWPYPDMQGGRARQRRARWEW